MRTASEVSVEVKDKSEEVEDSVALVVTSTMLVVASMVFITSAGGNAVGVVAIAVDLIFSCC